MMRRIWRDDFDWEWTEGNVKGEGSFNLIWPSIFGNDFNHSGECLIMAGCRIKIPWLYLDVVIVEGSNSFFMLQKASLVNSKEVH